MQRVYETVIWIRFDGQDFPYEAEVIAGMSLLAVLKLMRTHRLSQIKHAAVRSDEGIVRWKMGRGFWVEVS